MLLTNDDVEQVLTMADCVDVLRRFFEEEGNGQVLTRQRTESWVPHLTTDTFYQCKTMEGGVPYIGKYVIRIDSNVTRKKQQSQSSRVEHVPFGNGSWMGMLLVFSTETGEMVESIKKHTDWIQAISFSPDGVLLATADRNGGLHLWEAKTGRERGGAVGAGARSWQQVPEILLSCCGSPSSLSLS